MCTLHFFVHLITENFHFVLANCSSLVYNPTMILMQKGVLTMYERFRNEIAAALSQSYPATEVATILSKLDTVSVNYEFHKKCTELSPYNPDEIPELLRLYIGCKKSEGLSDATLAGYFKTLTLFFQKVRKPAGAVRTDEIRLYLYAYQQERKVTNQTLNKYREYICRFFHWLHTEGYIPADPAARIKPIRHETKPRQAMTQLELEHIRSACQSDRDRAIVETLYSTGCRVSELISIKLSDINWEAKTVHLFGKGKKHRESFINAKAEVAIKQYLSTRKGNSEYLFASTRYPYENLTKAAIEKIVRELVGRTGGNVHTHVTPHVFRHTTATSALNNGMPVEEISRLLGHSQINTTMVYAHSTIEGVQASHKRCVV